MSFSINFKSPQLGQCSYTFARALRTQFTTDAAVSARLHRLQQRRIWATRLILADVLFLGVLWAMPAEWQAAWRTWWVQLPMVACDAVMLMMAVPVFIAIGGSEERELLTELAKFPDLCSQVMLVAEQSQAVRDYVHNVNESDRQLRVFDVACVNSVYAEEQQQRIQVAGEGACARLHSL